MARRRPDRHRRADVLVIGDLNSYAKEDPIAALETAGYTNLVARLRGADAYSYVFDGQWGSLDHALGVAGLAPGHRRRRLAHQRRRAERARLQHQLQEPPGRSARSTRSDQFRIADHDPVLVDLALTVDVETTTAVNAGGYLVLANSAGIKAGDFGSRANFGLELEVQPDGDESPG